jgi:hypothetical protein
MHFSRCGAKRLANTFQQVYSIRTRHVVCRDAKKKKVAKRHLLVDRNDDIETSRRHFALCQQRDTGSRVKQRNTNACYRLGDDRPYVEVELPNTSSSSG